MNKLEEKIYNGEHLSESELVDAVFGCNEVDTVYGENYRWSRYVSTIIKIKDKLFCIDWEQGLTELQPDSFECQPYEVKEVEETVVVKKYVRV